MSGITPEAREALIAEARETQGYVESELRWLCRRLADALEASVPVRPQSGITPEQRAEARKLLDPHTERVVRRESWGQTEKSVVDYWEAVEIVAGLLAERSVPVRPTPEALREQANGEALKRYDGDWIIDDRTGEEVGYDDWGYSEAERRAFVAGAEWAAGHLWTVRPTPEALARAYDPEAFEDHPIEARSHVAAVQWAARRKLATDAAERVAAAGHLWTEPAAVEYGEGLLVDDNPDRYALRRGPWVEPRALDEGYVLMQRTVGPWVPAGSVPTETEGGSR